MSNMIQVEIKIHDALHALQNAIALADQIEVGGPQLAERLRVIHHQLIQEVL